MSYQACMQISDVRRPFARWDRNPQSRATTWTARLVSRLATPARKNVGQNEATVVGTSTCLSRSQRECEATPVSRRAHRRRVSQAPNSRPSCREALCKVLDLTSSSLGRVDRLHHASRRPPVKLSMVSGSVLSMASLNLVSLAAVLFLL